MPTTQTLKELLFGQAFPMIGTAMLGALFQWLLDLNLLHGRVLHGGLWILLLALLGAYMDYARKLLPDVWSRRPQLLGAILILTMNTVFAFWLVMMFDGLGLGFDVSMLGWWFKLAMYAATGFALLFMFALSSNEIASAEPPTSTRLAPR